MKTCEKCGKQFPEEVLFCTHCGSSFSSIQTSAAPSVERIPFEERQTRGFWKSLWDTWVKASLYPNSFFPLVGNGADMASAIFFALLWGEAAIIVSSIVIFFFELLAAAMGPGSAAASLLSGIAARMFLIILGPIFVLAALSFESGIVHLFLMLVGGSKKGFNTTICTWAYGYGLNIIPFVGWLLALIVQTIGLSRAHDVPIWKPILAIVIAFFVLCAIIIIPLILLVVISIHNHGLFSFAELLKRRRFYSYAKVAEIF